MTLVFFKSTRNFANTGLIEITLEEINHIIPHFLKIPHKKMSIDYDADADVLYISFEQPQKATDSEMNEDAILMRYRGMKLVGIIILDASKRKKK